MRCATREGDAWCTDPVTGAQLHAPLLVVRWVCDKAGGVRLCAGTLHCQGAKGLNPPLWRACVGRVGALLCRVRTLVPGPPLLRRTLSFDPRVAYARRAIAAAQRARDAACRQTMAAVSVEQHR
jgi:hypothetical protein